MSLYSREGEVKNLNLQKSIFIIQEIDAKRIKFNPFRIISGTELNQPTNTRVTKLTVQFDQLLIQNDQLLTN